jgi:hypothetical protein
MAIPFISCWYCDLSQSRWLQAWSMCNLVRLLRLFYWNKKAVCILSMQRPGYPISKKKTYHWYVSDYKTFIGCVRHGMYMLRRSTMNLVNNQQFAIYISLIRLFGITCWPYIDMWVELRQSPSNLFCDFKFIDLISKFEVEFIKIKWMWDFGEIKLHS